MIVFTDQNTLGRDNNGYNVILTRLISDTVTDLPDPDTYTSDNIIIAMGSRAYCIDTGKMYMLNSAGNWIEQVGMICYF